jgi:hypothetical protein
LYKKSGRNFKKKRGLTSVVNGQDVRADMSDTLDKIVPEAGPNGEALYRHDAEGMFYSGPWCKPGWD